MGIFTTTMGLAPEQAEQVIRLAGTAPSLHNAQPWRFRLHPQAIELHVDTAAAFHTPIPTTRSSGWAVGRPCSTCAWPWNISGCAQE